MKMHALALGLVMSSMAMGGLGSMDDKPWIGIFAGVDGRNFDFALGGDGESEVFFKKSGKRGSIHRTMIVRYVLQEQINGKWVTRRMDEESLESKSKPGLKHDEVRFTATYTGDTKVEVVHEFDGSEVAIGVKIVESVTRNPLRVGVYVNTPDFHQHMQDEDEMKERDLKKKIDDVRIEVVPLEGRKERVRDLHEEDTNLVKMFAKGALAVSFEADAMVGKEVTLSTRDETLGKFAFQQNKKLYHGFQTFWWPTPDKTGHEDCRLVIEVR
jgi:hypothetical protein